MDLKSQADLDELAASLRREMFRFITQILVATGLIVLVLVLLFWMWTTL